MSISSLQSALWTSPLSGSPTQTQAGGASPNGAFASLAAAAAQGNAGSSATPQANASASATPHHHHHHAAATGESGGTAQTLAADITQALQAYAGSSSAATANGITI